MKIKLLIIALILTNLEFYSRSHYSSAEWEGDAPGYISVDIGSIEGKMPAERSLVPGPFFDEGEFITAAGAAKINEAEICHDKLKKMFVAVEKDALNLNTAILDSIIKLYRLNEQLNSACFPLNENDYKLLYSAIDNIFQRAMDNREAIKFLFELNFTVKNNSELGEYLSALPYQIALKNTEDFLIVFQKLNEREKNIILDDLIWLVENNKLKVFLDALNRIDNPELKNCGEQINKYFEDYRKQGEG
jgi:hypothetical protein